jgi:hypothetical protein
MAGCPTLAGAILDHMIHNAYRIELTGETSRKLTTLETAAWPPLHSKSS